MKRFSGFIGGLATILFFPLRVWACAVCFGGPEAFAKSGLLWAILSLLGVLLFVLALFVRFIWQFSKRAAQTG